MRNLGLEVFGDSDFASRDTDGMPVSGHVALWAGACLRVGFSRTQKLVTLASTEVEFVAMAGG